MAFITQALKKLDPLGSAFGAYRAQELIDTALTPAKPEAPTGPSAAEISARQDAAAQEEQRRLSRGRTSTMLTGGRGLLDLGTTSKVLLGQ